MIPRELLFGQPDRTNPKISPDNRHTAYQGSVDGMLGLWLGAANGDCLRALTSGMTGKLKEFLWAADGRSVLLFMDQNGNETWRLFSVDIKSGKVVDHTPFDNVQLRRIAYNRRQPRSILVAMNHENPSFHDAYHLDLVTGEAVMLARNPGNVIKWVADFKQAVRACVTARGDGGYDLMVRENAGGEWETLLSWSVKDIAILEEDLLTCDVVGFSGDGKHLFVKDSLGSPTTRLVSIDLASKKIECLWEDPVHDVGETLVNPETGEVEAVCVLRARKHWHPLTENVAEDFGFLTRHMDGDFRVLGRDSADTKWIVRLEKDTAPPAYYYYDRKARATSVLFSERPVLDECRFSAHEPIAFTACDGLEIHGYLTRPLGSERKPAPLVLYPHGGPWARDRWCFDPEAQWLANRGYACLQVNFRGSTGYGKHFMNAGDREWGGAMQQDLVDAVHWAIEEGIADPERIAVFGGSYGGYAALAGAALTPDLFRCVVSYVGVSNLISFIESIPPYWDTLLQNLYQRVGHPEHQRELLRSRSPLFWAEKIKIPVLVAHGANDPRVKQQESEQIVSALHRNGVECEYLLFKDEGHGITKTKNRLAFYGATERFLARHLGGRCEPVTKEQSTILCEA